MTFIDSTLKKPTSSANKSAAVRAQPDLWMLIPTFYPVVGGAQTQVLRTAQILSDDGWDVRVVTRREGYAGLHSGLPSEDEVEGVPVTRVRSGEGKTGSLAYVLCGLWHLIKHGRRAIYHSHDVGASAWLAVLAGYLLRGHSVVKLRSGCHYYQKRYLRRRGPVRRLFLLLLRLADCIVVTNSEVERLLSELGVTPNRVVRIPNGADTTQFRPVPADGRTPMRRQLGLPDSKPLVLYVGRLAHLKGVDVLLCGWELLPGDLRDAASLVLVGDGAERNNLLRTIERLALEDSVLLVGTKKNVSDYYAASDIFVLPSRTEGLSNALLEAMARGMPVVASDVGGAPDIIQDGKSGLLFQSEDAAQLAEHLTTLLRSPEQGKNMGSEARRQVENCADLGMTVDNLKHLYTTRLQ